MVERTDFDGLQIESPGFAAIREGRTHKMLYFN
jgi:hypothetical protein